MKNGQYTNNKQFYKPFGNCDPNIVCKKLVDNKIKYVRQIVCLDEIFKSDEELNEKYLYQYLEISYLFNQYKIDVILDFHQDIFSRRLGGCGLPKKYFPQDLQNVIVELSDPKLWGATPVKSKEQKQCWKHFYNNCIEMYVRDICQVVQWLNNNINGKFSDIYKQIDIINEPGIPTMYKARFLIANNNYYKDKLLYLYQLAIEELNKIVDDQTYFGIEPFNYDVSQTAYLSIGLNTIKNLQEHLQNRIIYVPHLYQPVFTSRKTHIIENHLNTMKKLQLQQIQINEFGDLSFENDLKILEKQIKLMIQLDLDMSIWELDITYKNQQEAWNEEQMSVLQLYDINGSPELLETQCGNIYFTYTRSFSQYTIQNINISLKIYLSQYQCQRLQYAFIISKSQEVNLRLQCLHDKKYCKFIEITYQMIQENFNETFKKQLNLNNFDQQQHIMLCLCSKKYYQNFVYISFDQQEKTIQLVERN